jgi:RNA polymerase sigma-70 factor (ECF subfamily)
VEPTDEALVREAQAGRVEAFDRLMQRYQRLVCKVSMNYVKDKADALDVTQNVFLKAYRHLARVTAEGMFKPWLLRITYNESVNWLRRNKHERTHEALDEGLAAPGGPVQERRLERRESRSLLLAALEALNPRYRQAVSLRYAEGLRIREIATVMGCSEGVVKSLLHRGVRRIQKSVAGRAG